MDGSLDRLTIKGFKSIREIENFTLKNLNILVGANGAGKSNFIQIFHFLESVQKDQLSTYILEHGGADNFLYNGPKETPCIDTEFTIDGSSYKLSLTPTANETFIVHPDKKTFPKQNWQVYHFHDTSNTTAMRRSRGVEDTDFLRPDGSNIAPFLLALRSHKSQSTCYQEILHAIQMVNPFFEDFRLDIMQLGEAEKVKLSWKQKSSDYPMQPYHLSDGSIRFICLATALLQPNPPSCMIIDEPELGLHPEAIAVLAELIEAASKRTQVIIATQSPLLLNYFSIEDIVVVKRKDGQSTFTRLKEQDFTAWLEDYSVGELWTKNIIQGDTSHE